MDLTINALNALHAKSFPPTPPATLPSASPTLRVTIDGNNRSETLFLGDPVKATASAGATSEAPVVTAGETEYVAQLMNGNSVRAPVFTVVVPNRLLERLRKAQDDLRERRILDFDAASVTSISLSAPNQPSVTLQRLEPNGPESPWQIVRRPRRRLTVAAPAALLQQALDRHFLQLRLLRGSELRLWGH